MKKLAFKFLLVHFRLKEVRYCERLQGLWQSKINFLDCSTRKGFAMTKGFTLAEVLVTLTILGVVAALTVPSIVHNNQTRINKTRLKKAMSVYDRAISQMSVVSGFKTKDAFKNWAQENDCDNAVSYFKVAGDTREGCKFRTSDGIWWDVSEIDRTIIAFKQADLTIAKAQNSDDKSAFVLVTSFDQTNETLRVDDLGYETSNDIDSSYTYVAKLYQFLGIIEKILSEFTRKCISVDETHCKIGDDIFEKVILTEQIVTKGGVNNTGNAICVLDRNTNQPDCDTPFESKVNAGDIAFFMDTTVEESEAKDCTDSVFSSCSTSGDYYQAAMRKCTNGTHLATLAELKALNDIGKLSNGSTYWSSTERKTSTAYLFPTSTGKIATDNKDRNGTRRIVCVGN